MEEIVLGIDIGTTKICALVGEVRNREMRIIGLGMQPSAGMRKGMIVDVPSASVALAAALEAAEQTSGYQLSQALISVAGEHISSTNNRGLVAINRNEDGVTPQDIDRALETAQAIAIPSNRQIVHLIPRHYTIDDHAGVRQPLGMHGYRLEIEAHIVTAATSAIQNLTHCAETVGIKAEEMVLNALASGEAVLEPAEREMGVLIADIGGGTTDLALYKQGTVWHTKVIPIGGYHITNDIAIGLRAPYEVAEKVKIQYGDCRPAEIDPDFVFMVEPFGGEKIQVGRQDLAQVIEARVEEIFHLILKDIQQSGYDEYLPAGIVLTGGTALLRGITSVAERVLNVPARVATPKNLVGLVDSLHSPAYATSVGLLRWAGSEHHRYQTHAQPAGLWGRRMGSFIRTLLPG
ncbi:Cell division protein FtsA [Candidatus Promineifilum breve]|uniref:Cell division protein FtsA n=1 Tax=Candidatus Promineifilum breve TaxID=1806508 RepID=A0A160T1Q1_9CHLR|nr:cell division protein FtsA [Candidatus Promineifilum breve]CUS02748.2 Cell division protein FtsA [Candidatus Promineifilum breve]